MLTAFFFFFWQKSAPKEQNPASNNPLVQESPVISGELGACPQPAQTRLVASLSTGAQPPLTGVLEGVQREIARLGLPASIQARREAKLPG